MKNFKTFLPTFAFLFSITMALASEQMENPADYYLNSASVCTQIPETSCNGGPTACFVQIGPNFYQVYDFLDGTVCAIPELKTP